MQNIELLKQLTALRPLLEMGDDGVDSTAIEYSLRYALGSASAKIKAVKGLASQNAILDFSRKWQVPILPPRAARHTSQLTRPSHPMCRESW